MKRRYPGVTTDVIDGAHIRRMGMAARLFDHLVSRQTDPNGAVNYGKPMTYAEIANEIPNPPSPFTVRNWIRTLRDEKYIDARIVRAGKPARVLGLAITILRPKKWALQLPLFDGARAFGKTVQDPAEILRNPVPAPRPDLVGPSDQIWSGNSLRLREREIEKPFRPEMRGPGRAATPRAGMKLFNLQQKARRLESEIDVHIEVTAGAVRGTSEYAMAEAKFLRLSAELRETCRQIELARVPAYDERKTG